MHGDNAVAERFYRNQFEVSRARQAVLVQSGAVAGDPGVNEELVLVDQIQPIQLGRKLAAAQEHARRGRILEILYGCSQITGDVVAIVPKEVGSR